MAGRSIPAVTWKCLGAWSALAAIGTVAPCAFAEPPAAAAPVVTSATAPVIDEKAIAILKRVETTMIRLRSYQAECWTTTTHDAASDGTTRPTTHTLATLAVEKPGRMHYDSWTMNTDASGALSRKSETPELTFVSDGTTYWRQYGSTYSSRKLTTPEQLGTLFEPWGGFYYADPFANITEIRKGGNLLEVRDAGPDTVDGIPTEKVFLHYKVTLSGLTQEYRATWYVSTDGLVRRRLLYTTVNGRRGTHYDATLRAIRTDASAAANSPLFTYTAPAGVTLQVVMPPKQVPLLANGTSAPDFKAIDKDGNPVTLASLKGKVVVLDFWASWCGPCAASMPHNEEVAKKLKAEGAPVVILALDNSEDHGFFADWITDHPKFDALRFAYADPKVANVCGAAYQITGIPTQYVIDAAGIIRASFVGYGGPSDDLENAIRAALKSK